MEQIERIRQMEQNLNRALQVVQQLTAALDEFDAAQDAIRQLTRYYGSDEWRRDLAADEAGLLPRDLKRGVLSEDGIWNLLSDLEKVEARITERPSLS